MFGIVRVHARPQRLVGGADARRLVDADLFVDGEVQREVEEGVGLSAFRRPFLVQGAGTVGKQGVIFGMARGDVGGGDFGADQRQAFLMLFPGIAEEPAHLLA